MHIGIFTESYLPYISGVTISIETLRKELLKLGHRVSIFAPRYPGHTDKDPDIYRFPSVGVPKYPGFRIALPPLTLMETLSKLKIDLIHSQHPYLLGRLSLRFAKRHKIPYVYTFHTLFKNYLHYIPLVPKEISGPLLSMSVRGFCNQCACVIVPTSEIKTLLQKEGINVPIEVIPTGVDLDLVRNADPQRIRIKHALPPEAKILLHVGRLSEEKNIPFLLNAFKLIREKVPAAYLMIVASGPKEKELKALAPANTIFVRQVPPPAIFDYYAAADIFVFSSLSETQGLVLTEAKAAGLPIVAVSAPGLSEIADQNKDGFLTPSNAEEFSEKAVLLLKDPSLRKSFSAQAFKNSQRFSSREWARRIEAVYKSLLQ